MTKEEAFKLSYISPIVFFDGVCHLCHWSVKFLIKKDKNNRLLFSYLQSETGLNTFGVNYNIDIPDSICFLESGKIYTRSTGALRAFKYVSGITRFLNVFIIVPVFIRNIVYNFISKHRYSWFGRDESCLLPTPEIKNKFID